MLDDATAAFLAKLAESGLPPMHELTPQEARAAGAAIIELYGRGPEMLRVEEVDTGASSFPASASAA